MASKDFIAKAQHRRSLLGRSHAELSIETALLVSEARIGSEEQLSDLADAVDAFKAKQYPVAVELAEASVYRGRRLTAAIRPLAMLRTVAEIRSMFGELQAADRPPRL